jgi:antitoxin ParD1/3/4
MNVSLTPELEKFIQDKVSSGLYTSASEVIRESLRLLNAYDELHQKRLEQLNQSIDQGLAQLEQGQGMKADEVYQRLHSKLSLLNKGQ